MHERNSKPLDEKIASDRFSRWKGIVQQGVGAFYRKKNVVVVRFSLLLRRFQQVVSAQMTKISLDHS